MPDLTFDTLCLSVRAINELILGNLNPAWDVHLDEG